MPNHTKIQRFKVKYEDPIEEREFVADCFREKVERMDWNINKEGNWIVPVLHGTSLGNALSICQRGFAALGTTDDGWYGKGTLPPYWRTRFWDFVTACAAEASFPFFLVFNENSFGNLKYSWK